MSVLTYVLPATDSSVTAQKSSSGYGRRFEPCHRTHVATQTRMLHATQSCNTAERVEKHAAARNPKAPPGQTGGTLRPFTGTSGARREDDSAACRAAHATSHALAESGCACSIAVWAWEARQGGGGSGCEYLADRTVGAGEALPPEKAVVPPEACDRVRLVSHCYNGNVAKADARRLPAEVGGAESRTAHRSARQGCRTSIRAKACRALRVVCRVVRCHVALHDAASCLPCSGRRYDYCQPSLPRAAY